MWNFVWNRGPDVELQEKSRSASRANRLISFCYLERETRFELATSTLATRSTG